jgi:hypothetical protein
MEVEPVPRRCIGAGKRCCSFLVFAAALLLGGCATPLNVAKDSGRFAEALGISRSDDVLFLSYGAFGKSPKGPKPSFTRIDGAAVATASMLHMTPEKAEEKTESERISVKYSQIQTVAVKHQGFGCEIQMDTGDHVIILWVTPNKLRWDCDASNALLDLIAATGVPVVEAQKWYDFTGGGGIAPIYIGPLF